MRLAALLCAAALARAQDAPSVTQRWAGWLADEVVAQRYSRTREEVEQFGTRCAGHAAAWAAVADAHASLARVLVVDTRHNWNGLGDSHERWNFLLRVGRSLGRATFLWSDGCADDKGPLRMSAPGVPPPVRPPGCQFDPGAFVLGFGAVSWRWDAAARHRVERAQGGEGGLVAPHEEALQYRCLQEQAGCVQARLTWANGSVALTAARPTAAETAEVVLDFLGGPALAALPWLRLETTVQGDLTREAFSARACTAAGHAPRPGCDQKCESFANWRPRPRTWAALRPSLLRMDAWAAVTALSVRTGVADHVGRHSDLLTPPPLDPAAGEGMLGGEADAEAAAAALLGRVEALFTPCAEDAPRFVRDRKRDEVPCVHWRSDEPVSEPPSAAKALACGGGGASVAAAEAAAAANGLHPALFNASGPFSTFIACAARAAAALAAQDAAPRSFGVVIFSDSPALKCVAEASELALAGHVLVTPSVPGHIQYAPPGPVLRAAGLSAVSDWYLLGLVDVSLVAFSSAFSGAANVRATRPRRHPPGAADPLLRRGFERWFGVGRENQGLWPEDVDTLRLLTHTHPGCPTELRAVRAAAALYDRLPEEVAGALHAGRKRGEGPA